jgi:stearoyl-CoA desaturase (delta-9 desaturase)
MPSNTVAAPIRRFRVATFAVIAAIHVAAAAAPWFFSWSGLALMLVLYVLTGGVGVTLCYHRLLTHSSFKTHRSVRYFLTLCGCLAMQGPPITWVAHHRLHHKESDMEPDPHSPVIISFLWSHVLWLFWHTPGLETHARQLKYARDLERDPGIVLLQRLFIPVNIAFAVGVFAAGWAVGGAYLAVSWLLWGCAMRMVVTWHATWLVNSATHLWGYRNYNIEDNSRNTWWVALLTFGEGWHNNHHADQRSAAHGHRWFEFDPTHWAIRLLEHVGLAWDVVEPRRTERIQRREAA